MFSSDSFVFLVEDTVGLNKPYPVSINPIAPRVFKLWPAPLKSKYSATTPEARANELLIPN